MQAACAFRDEKKRKREKKAKNEDRAPASSSMYLSVVAEVGMELGVQVSAT